MVGGGGVDGGGDFWLVGPVEQHSQAGERPRQAGGVTGLMERVEARGAQVQGPAEVAVNGFEPGGFARAMTASKKREPVLSRL